MPLLPPTNNLQGHSPPLSFFLLSSSPDILLLRQIEKLHKLAVMQDEIYLQVQHSKLPPPLE